MAASRRGHSRIVELLLQVSFLYTPVQLNWFPDFLITFTKSGEKNSKCCKLFATLVFVGRKIVGKYHETKYTYLQT